MSTNAPIAISLPGGRRVDASVGRHVIRSDQPLDKGGQDLVPSPFDYFLANPWKGGRQPEPDKASSHGKTFRDTAVRIRQSPPAPKKR